MSVSELEAEVKEYKLQLETVVAGLQADPDNSELQNLRTELEEFISLTESSIAELKPVPVSAPPPPPPPSSSTPKEKWSKENHPAFQAGYRRPGAPPPPSAESEKSDQAPVYKVNDMVMAKWKSGDRAFYPAKITSITGSSTKPVYIVTFKSYNNTETLFSHEIRPQNNQYAGQKRKADDAVATTTANNASAVSYNSAIDASGPSYSSAPGVISAATTVDPAMASAVRNPADQAASRGALDGSGPKPPKVPKKISNTKALEGAKSKWQEFSAGGKGKSGKKKQKDSMFRTGESVKAKVGFTGSGQAMRKDQARTRHIYDQGGEDDY